MGGEKDKGLVVVITGDGKGKTTSALGTALRALGHGMKVLMIQFIKGTWRYGELKMAEKLNGFKILRTGVGFVKENNLEESKRAARKAWELAKEEIKKAGYDMYILDEINYSMGFGFIDPEEVREFLESEKPPHVHVILTGRGRFREVEEIADLVSEVRKIKHPFDRGISAVKGIDF